MEKSEGRKTVWDQKITPALGLRDFQVAQLQKDLGIATYGDLITYFPLRHQNLLDASSLGQLKEGDYLFSRGVLGSYRSLRKSNRTLLKSSFRMGASSIPLIWFNKTDAIKAAFKSGQTYTISGKISSYKNRLALIHPEFSPAESFALQKGSIRSVYATTAKLSSFGLDTKGIRKLIYKVLKKMEGNILENLPAYFLSRYKLASRAQALADIHFPPDAQALRAAERRLKFEEVFLLQWKLSRQQHSFQEKRSSFSFSDASLARQFCSEALSFPLTAAQKRVLKEIWGDLKSGQQMNRLLQGDVGSGKTIVAFLSSLLPRAHKAQTVLMAPTELLAQQHAQTFSHYGAAVGLKVELLTGSTPKSEREQILQRLRLGEVDILVGTHALLESQVRFARLGLVIIDEQHRFGVAQRARLWHKEGTSYPPHLLVMTATPIPRTLAMTLYKHLDISLIDELPPERKSVRTLHFKEGQRLRLFSFLSKKIAEGRQVYMVYPLIEESQKMSYKNLMDGYESICRAFPNLPVGILHGRMKPQDKSYEMERFAEGTTKIMVATTVVEVGVNVPNATVMVVESAQHFGLVQLHQLRGRIRRGKEQGYCILMTENSMNNTAKQRIEAMLKTSDGFRIADIDLKLRGPGNLVGLEQSGIFKMKLADLSQDLAMVREARKVVAHIHKVDHGLTDPSHALLRRIDESSIHWEQVS